MRSRETLIRLQRFQVDEKRRAVGEIEVMIADFERKIAELDQQISLEQERSGITDVKHFAYPMFAKAAGDRKEKLLESIDGLKAQLVKAQDDLAEEFGELKKMELIEEKDIRRRDDDYLAHEQSELDEAALNLHRQNF
jgi:flagellar export protein FliJ